MNAQTRLFKDITKKREEEPQNLLATTAEEMGEESYSNMFYLVLLLIPIARHVYENDDDFKTIVQEFLDLLHERREEINARRGINLNI